MTKNLANFEIVLFISFIIIFSLNIIFDFGILLNQTIPFLWALFYVFDVYKAIKYKSQSKINRNNFKLRSSKDLLNSGLSFVFGLFMLILSVIFSFEGDFYPYIFIIFGVTLMLKSKYYIPSAELNIENGFLFLKNNKVQVKVELNTIKEINIYHYYLSVQKNDFEELLFRDVNINKDEAVEIKRVTSSLTNLEFKIHL